MYNSRPGLLIGFHGCEASARDALIRKPDTVKQSDKPYDWLGHGMYFWENNAERALQWAKDKKKRGEIRSRKNENIFPEIDIDIQRST
jgi:hypothetical protein